MKRLSLLSRLIPGICLLALICCHCGSASPASSDAQLESVIGPYRFDFVRWEYAAFTGANSPFRRHAPVDITDTRPVLRYLGLVQAIRAQEALYSQAISEGEAPDPGDQAAIVSLKQERDDLAPLVERIVAGQASTIYREMGIYTPLDRYMILPTTLPGIWFKLDVLPHLLVISPRDRIESTNKIMLRQEFQPEEIESIETRIAGLGVSALIVGLGGFGGTYPSFVASDPDLRFMMQTVCEEWLHQYLAFTPLGFRYVLDVLRIKPDYDIITMNETLAGIVSDEVAEGILARYYPAPSALAVANNYRDEPFDFYLEMRQVRLQVDALLAAGQVDEAEQYMAERREYFQQNGYYIRKLNQAYFAFYGTYADSPASVDPIGDAMRALRTQSSSLAGFLNTAVTLTSQQQLFNLTQTEDTR
ncbi:MAG: hypothetical protein ACYCZF_01655 [Anaerolineae bacterium]